MTSSRGRPRWLCFLATETTRRRLARIMWSLARWPWSAIIVRRRCSAAVSSRSPPPAWRRISNAYRPASIRLESSTSWCAVSNGVAAIWLRYWRTRSASPSSSRSSARTTRFPFNTLPRVMCRRPVGHSARLLVGALTNGRRVATCRALEHDQAVICGDLTRRWVTGRGQPLVQQLHREPGDLVLVRRDRGKRRVGVPAVLDAVDADHRDVVRNSQAALGQRPDRPERQRVVEAEH